MNVPVPELIREWLQMVDERDIKEFFDSLEQAEYAQIRAASTKKLLTTLRDRVILLGELRHFLLTARQKQTPL